MKIEALGAPPYPTNAEKAVTIIINGIHNPTSVKASSPTTGICQYRYGLQYYKAY